MNNVKTSRRSVVKQENLVNQMRIIISGPKVEDFDPSSSVLHWLESGTGSRHLTYRQRQSKESVNEPSTSQASTSAVYTEELVHDIFETLDDNQKTFFKEKFSKDQCRIQ